MSTCGLRMIVAAGCLMGGALGCQGIQTSPGGIPPDALHQSGPSEDGGPYDGWLSKRLARQGRTASPRESPAGVQRASHVQPTTPAGGDTGPVFPAVGGASPAATGEDKDSGLELSDFYPSNIVATVKELTGNGPNEAVARALYQEGEALFQERKYQEAAERFKRAAKRAPESPLQEDCLFMAGESLFFSDRYPEAHAKYAELLKKYENTRYLDTVVARQFAIGRYWERLNAADPAWLFTFQWEDETRPRFDTWGHALKAYQSVLENDPTGPLADDSIMATGNAYFLKGRYEDAAYQYDLLRKEYPKSEHLLNGLLLGMQSKLKMYQGPTYDGSPLEDANRIAEQTLLQFGPELGNERDRLVQTQNRILEQRAQRHWALAQFYEKKKHYGSARLYYQRILDDFPTTAAAQMAQARLAEIQPLPARPPNRFEWLTDLFPSTQEP